jgi:hypothetical protein
VSADQYVCEHGHRYYDGDQGVGSPYDDGYHDRLDHVHADIEAWEPAERDAYEAGWDNAGDGAR